MSNNYNFTPTLDGLNNVYGDTITCTSIYTKDIETETIEVSKSLNIASDKKINLGDEDSSISYSNGTNILTIGSGTSSSSMYLKTNNSSGNQSIIDINTSRVIIPQPYTNIGVTNGALGSTELRLYGSQVNGVGVSRNGFMLTSSSYTSTSVPMGLVNVIDQLFDIAVNCGNVAQSRDTAKQGIQMRFDSRSTEKLWQLQCVERTTGTVRNAVNALHTGVCEIPTQLDLLSNVNMNQSGAGIISQTGTGTNAMKAITLNVDNNLTQSGTGIISQTGTGTNLLKAITLDIDDNLTQSGAGIISQTGTGTNLLKTIDVSGDINFTGNLTQGGIPFTTPASTITLTSDNTAGNYYIPFTKTTASSANSLFIDDTTTPLTYNPSTATINSPNISTNTLVVNTNVNGNTSGEFPMNCDIKFSNGKRINQSNLNSATNLLTTTYIQGPTSGTPPFAVNDSGGKGLLINPYCNTASINSTTVSTDVGIFGNGGSPNITALNISVYGTTATGVRIESTKTTVTSGIMKWYDGSTQYGEQDQTSMTIVEDINYFLGRTDLKCATYDLNYGTGASTQAQNLVQMGIVRIVKGETYSGVWFYASGATITFRCALYNVGVSGARLAQRTTNYTSVAGWNVCPFDGTYQNTDVTKYVCIMLVPTNTTHTTYTYNNGNVNWGRAASANTINLLASYYTGFTGTFPANFTGTATAAGSKYFLGLY